MPASAGAQLVVVLLTFAITIATIVYKFGQLEGRVVTKLEDHERRIGTLEGERRWYVRRADDHP
jgi:hypothetical protein